MDLEAMFNSKKGAHLNLKSWKRNPNQNSDSLSEEEAEVGPNLPSKYLGHKEEKLTKE